MREVKIQKKKKTVLVLQIVSFGLMASVVSRCQGSQSTICLRPRDKQEASELRTATETETAARVFFFGGYEGWEEAADQSSAVQPLLDNKDSETTPCEPRLCARPATISWAVCLRDIPILTMMDVYSAHFHHGKNKMLSFRCFCIMYTTFIH